MAENLHEHILDKRANRPVRAFIIFALAKYRNCIVSEKIILDGVQLSKKKF